MKLFLIVYDRETASRVNMTTYESTDRSTAERVRFERELALSGEGSRYEVVLIETDDEKTLRKTHRRYFRSVRELANTSSAQSDDRKASVGSKKKRASA